jgi:Icc-related predicted phosphoesterase
VIRVAAVGDVHVGVDSVGSLRRAIAEAEGSADMMLLAGDLTQAGTIAEADVLADELAGSGLPIVAVLGNHDYHSDLQAEVRARIEAVGVRVLEGEHHVVDVGGATVGIIGGKGFAGGFTGASVSAFGEPEMKAFARHAEASARRIGDAGRDLDTDVTIMLLHYAPVPDTLRGEPVELYPFLGSYLLAQAADALGVDLVVHGHAHRGGPLGVTPGGVGVRNVAQPVIGRPFAVFTFPDPGTRGASERPERDDERSADGAATDRGSADRPGVAAGRPAGRG